MKRMTDDPEVFEIDREFSHRLGLDQIVDPLEDMAGFEEYHAEHITSEKNFKRLRAMISGVDILIQRLTAVKAGMYAVEARFADKYAKSEERE